MKDIFYCPLNLGANKCGIEFGYSEFIKKYPKYKNDINLINIEISEDEDFSNKKLKFKNSVIKTLNSVAKKIDISVKNDKFVILVGGDHSLAISSISAITNNLNEDLGVIWVDAHGDMNTKDTSLSGHIHGMPLASMIGFGDEDLKNILHSNKKLNYKNCVIFGVRDLDVEEKKFMDRLEMNYFPMEKIREMGFENALKQASDYLKKRVNKVHISFDLDSICPSELAGVSTPVVKGFSKKEGTDIINYILKNNYVTSVDIVEYNPLYEIENDTSSYIYELLNILK